MLGEIRSVAFPFAPQGWAICDGSLVPVNQYSALFDILGTQYGGNGVTTFGLPDLRGRAIVTAGAGTNLTSYKPGAKAGQERVALTLAQLPAHVHSPSGTVQLNTKAGNTSSPGGNYLANTLTSQYGDGKAGQMADNLVKGIGTNVGGGQPHENLQPFLVLTYIIALTGENPRRP